MAKFHSAISSVSFHLLKVGSFKPSESTNCQHICYYAQKYVTELAAQVQTNRTFACDFVKERMWYLPHWRLIVRCVAAIDGQHPLAVLDAGTVLKADNHRLLQIQVLWSAYYHRSENCLRIWREMKCKKNSEHSQKPGTSLYVKTHFHTCTQVHLQAHVHGHTHTHSGEMGHG